MIKKLLQDFKDKTLTELINKIIKKLNELIDEFVLICEKFDITEKTVNESVQDINESVQDINECVEVVETYNNRLSNCEININSLEIGGRNYFPNMKGSEWDIEITNGNKWTNTELSEYMLKFTPNQSHADRKVLTINIEPNTTYTLSCTCNLWLDFRETSDGNVEIRRHTIRYVGETVTTENVNYTFTTNSNTTLMHLWIGNNKNYIENTELFIKNLKLEKGNKATDWTPSPEDIQSQINDILNRLSLLENK